VDAAPFNGAADFDHWLTRIHVGLAALVLENGWLKRSPFASREANATVGKGISRSRGAQGMDA
jgi:hypothetical protein